MERLLNNHPQNEFLYAPDLHLRREGTSPAHLQLVPITYASKQTPIHNFSQTVNPYNSDNVGKNVGWDFSVYAGNRHASDPPGTRVQVKNNLDPLHLHWDKHYN